MFYDWHACRVTKFQNFQRFAATICYQKTIDKGILSQKKNAGGTSITQFFRGWLQYVSNITVAKKRLESSFYRSIVQQFRLRTMHKLQENPFYRYKEPIKPLNIIRSHCSSAFFLYTAILPISREGNPRSDTVSPIGKQKIGGIITFFPYIQEQ